MNIGSMKAVNLCRNMWIASHLQKIEVTNENTKINRNYLVFEDNLCYFDEIHRSEVRMKSRQTKKNNSFSIIIA